MSTIATRSRISMESLCPPRRPARPTLGAGSSYRGRRRRWLRAIGRRGPAQLREPLEPVPGGVLRTAVEHGEGGPAVGEARRPDLDSVGARHEELEGVG